MRPQKQNTVESERLAKGVRLQGPRRPVSMSLEADSDVSYQKIHGLQNLEELHRHVRERRAQGRLKAPKPESPEPAPRANYLEELKEQRDYVAPPKQMLQRIARADLGRVGEYEALKQEAGRLDAGAQRHEKFMRNNRDMSLWESLELRRMADEQSLAAIRAKLSLLKVNKFDRT